MLTDDRAVLLSEVLASQAFAETTRLFFEHADLLDIEFFQLLRQVRYQDRGIILEAVAQSTGILEDPEVVGGRERRILAEVAHAVLASAGVNWPAADGAGRISSDGGVRALLAIATAGTRFNQGDQGRILALIHFAETCISPSAAVPGAPDPPALLRALCGIARGQTLVLALDRNFDALQYLKAGGRALEYQFSGWLGPADTELEKLQIRIHSQMLHLTSLPERE